jgi:hypothetical protein
MKILHTNKNSTEMQGEIKCSERFCSSIGTRCATHDKNSAVVILFARQIIYCHIVGGVSKYPTKSKAHKRCYYRGNLKILDEIKRT